MGLEADLDIDIKVLLILLEHLKLYKEFTRLGYINLLVLLLIYKNIDIAINTIKMILEFINKDI